MLERCQMALSRPPILPSTWLVWVQLISTTFVACPGPALASLDLDVILCGTNYLNYDPHRFSSDQLTKITDQLISNSRYIDVEERISTLYEPPT